MDSQSLTALLHAPRAALFLARLTLIPSRPGVRPVGSFSVQTTGRTSQPPPRTAPRTCRCRPTPSPGRQVLYTGGRTTDPRRATRRHPTRPGVLTARRPPARTGVRQASHARPAGPAGTALAAR